MADFILKQLPYDLSNQAGLALIGKYLKRINLNALRSILAFRCVRASPTATYWYSRCRASPSTALLMRSANSNQALV